MLMCISEINTTIYTATTLTAATRSYSQDTKNNFLHFIYITHAQSRRFVMKYVDKIDKNSCAKQRININRMNVNK